MEKSKILICIGVAATGIGSVIAGIVTGITIDNTSLSLALTICGTLLTGIGGVAYELAEVLQKHEEVKLKVAEILQENPNRIGLY